MGDQTASTLTTDEPLYRETRRLLLAPRAQFTGLIYIALFVIFAWSQFASGQTLTSIAVLLAVLFVHELGHLAGMRLFGFRDVRMFFIPFLGAAVSGRPHGAAGWKDAFVSLLGPGPGIALAIGGIIALQPYPLELLFTAIQMLLLINAFNLLPLGALDGGRFLQRVLFARHRVLEVGFIAVGSLALGLLALWGEMFVLAAFALLGLLVLPARWRVLGAAARLRQAFPQLDPAPERLGDVEGVAVFDEAGAILGSPTDADATKVAATMESILDALRRPPGVLASIVLLLIYGATWVLALIGVVYVSVHSVAPDWRVVDRGAFRVEFPGDPGIWPHRAPTPAGERDTELARVAFNGVERTTAYVVDAGEPLDPTAWIDFERDDIATLTKTRVERESPITVSGLAGREIFFRSGWREVQARLVVDGSRLYVATASAPKLNSNASRFMGSFAIVGAQQPTTAR